MHIYLFHAIKSDQKFVSLVLIGLSKSQWNQQYMHAYLCLNVFLSAGHILINDLPLMYSFTENDIKFVFVKILIVKKFNCLSSI